MPERAPINPATLRALRLQLGHSQASLAKRSKVSERTIIRIEQGQSRGQHRSLRRLARALAVDPMRLTEAS